MSQEQAGIALITTDRRKSSKMRSNGVSKAEGESERPKLARKGAIKRRGGRDARKEAKTPRLHSSGKVGQREGPTAYDAGREDAREDSSEEGHGHPPHGPVAHPGRVDHGQSPSFTPPPSLALRSTRPCVIAPPPLTRLLPVLSTSACVARAGAAAAAAAAAVCHRYRARRLPLPPRRLVLSTATLQVAIVQCTYVAYELLNTTFTAPIKPAT
ncbi:hypothetical protein BC834DRAFT_847201 [Gloeopeniophorella convolvens]|nr:hypothetical protein BC834DRAFT_847201 [Gloeopeniophorella convolvens]